MAAFLANVGVNARHAASSPLFPDGTFELLPIPEQVAFRPPMLRFRNLPAVRCRVPARWADRAAHLDPDLVSTIPTYGDNCRRAGRAFSLRRARPGDVIVFLARLCPLQSAPSFHLVGSLMIEDAIADLTVDPGAGWWDANAHVRRARATGVWDSFWVFKGGRDSRLFKRAVPFGRPQAIEVLGEGCRWPEHRSELQTIGSYTRAVRRFEDAGEEWLRAACRS